MNMKKYLFGTAFLLFTSTFGIASAEAIAPDEMVKNTANEVIEVLKENQSNNGAMDINQVGKLVEDKIASKFDFERMSRMVLGKNWVLASKSQQDQFVIEFRSLLVRTYSSALQKFKGQTIEYKPMMVGATENEANVKTLVSQPGSTPIPIEYALERKADTWNLYDVRIDGLSLVTSYRGQFSEEIRKNGIEGVIQKLTEKNKG